MTIEITQDIVYVSIILVLMAIQIYQRIQLEKVKKEVDKLWSQISTFNTMVAIKFLENEKSITNLKEKYNTNEPTEKI